MVVKSLVYHGRAGTCLLAIAAGTLPRDTYVGPEMHLWSTRQCPDNNALKKTAQKHQLASSAIHTAIRGMGYVMLCKRVL